jgi:hypothetical protein
MGLWLVYGGKSDYLMDDNWGWMRTAGFYLFLTSRMVLAVVNGVIHQP